MESQVSKATLLGLPGEIRLLIWDHLFANTDIHLHYRRGPRGLVYWDDCPHCEECVQMSGGSTTDNLVSIVPSGNIADEIPWLTRDYNDKLEVLLLCKTIYSEAIDLFQSTLTLHARSSETLAFISSCAPPRLREQATKIVLFIHLQNQNEMAWYSRLVELNNVLPGLKHVAINYHMHAPASYNELGDAIYMSMPLFALNPPFNKPLYIVTEHNRSEECFRRVGGKVIPGTDPQPGVSIHTSYKRNEILFASPFLGEVTTQDVIDEHTSVIRSLFEDEAYLSAANLFLASDVYHESWRRYGPYKIPRAEVPAEIINVRGGRALLDALVQVSRRFERPWFEKLQKRRLLELYMENSEMTKEEAEEMLDRQIAMMGDQGIAGLVETLLDDEGQLQVSF